MTKRQVFTNVRRTIGFPLSVVGAIIWIIAAALLIIGDAITGRQDGDQLLGLRHR